MIPPADREAPRLYSRDLLPGGTHGAKPRTVPTRLRGWDWCAGKFFLIVLSLAVFIGGLPFLTGALMTPREAMFYGNTVVAPADASIYYSYIEQGRAGRIFMADALTAEQLPASLWQPVWWLLGQLANALRLTNPEVFFLGRVLTMPVLLTTLWWLTGWLFRDRRQRRVAWLLTIFAGGFGGLASLLAGHPITTNGLLPPDMWVSEMYTVLTLWGSPHFLLVTSGILFVLGTVERSWLERQWRTIPLAGLVALLTLGIHPFHLITWIIVWAAITVWRWLADRQFPAGYAGRWLVVLLMASPAVLLYGLQLLFDPLTIGRASQNINHTAGPLFFLLGLGVFSVAAVVGAWLWRPRDERWRWAVTLAAAYIVAVYLPVSFQRRLSQGLMIPLALLSVPVILKLEAIRRSWRRFWRLIAIAVFLAATVTTWPVVYGLIVKDYVDELTVAPKRMYYLSSEFIQLSQYVRSSTDRRQPLLAPLLESNVLAGLTAHQVYVGYGVETLNFNRKLETMRWFFSKSPQEEQRRFLIDQRLCYVLDSPRAQAYGGAFVPTTWTDLTAVWRGPTLSLYRFQGCR